MSTLSLHNLEDIKEALQSDNPSQVLIAEMCLRVSTLLLEKNKAYGNSAFEPPLLAPELNADTGIRVRLSDKIKRMINILKDVETLNTKSFTEPLPQTILDAVGYMTLWLIEIERKTNADSK